jgi:hypothetical protein
MGDPHIHPRFVLPNIIDAVGNDLAFGRIREVMSLDSNGLPVAPPRASGILIIANVFLLFGVDGKCGLVGSLLRFDTAPDVLKLRIAVRMLFALDGLAIRLQAVARRLQQLPHRGAADCVALRFQLSG